MQDFIPKKKDINGDLGTVTIKQYDNNSRFLHVTLFDADLSNGEYGDSDAFIMQDCTAALYIQPEGSDDPDAVNYVAGEIADAENGVVTFLIPGGVTQIVGTYDCEIWIYGSNEETHPIISTKPFKLVVEKSIRNDSAIEASPSFSALDVALLQTQGFEHRISALEAATGGYSSDELDDALVQIQSIGERLAAVEETNPENVADSLAALSDRVDSVDTALNDCSRYITGIDATYSEKSRLLSNVTDIGTFYITQDMTENGQTVLRWTDLPAKNMNFIVKNARYSVNWILQTAVSTASPGIVYKRLIPSVAGIAAGNTSRDWVCTSNFDYRKQVLVIGDSISKGWRNGNLGYAGLLGLPYVNLSVSGSTISTVRPSTSATTIPDQIGNIDVDAQQITINGQSVAFTPSIIIANGGINDYMRSAPLGTIPTQPANSSSVSSIDASTVAGGLQLLFYRMIDKYPAAHRYFIIMHKLSTTNPGVTGAPTGYYVATRNSAGYTQQDLHDTIVACCKVYNVEVIDVYEKGFINSFFASYRSDIHYTGTDSVNNQTAAINNNTDYLDSDGIHPLNKGYQECYVPLIMGAIKSAM